MFWNFKEVSTESRQSFSFDRIGMSIESLLKSFNHPVFRACNCDGNCFWVYQKEMEECRGRASRHAARIRIELTLEVIYYLFFLFLLIARTSKLFFHNSRWHGTKPLPYEQHLQWILNHGGRSLDLYWTFNNVYNGSNLAIHTWCVT